MEVLASERPKLSNWKLANQKELNWSLENWETPRGKRERFSVSRFFSLLSFLLTPTLNNYNRLSFLFHYKNGVGWFSASPIPSSKPRSSMLKTGAPARVLKLTQVASILEAKGVHVDTWRDVWGWATLVVNLSPVHFLYCLDYTPFFSFF